MRPLKREIQSTVTAADFMFRLALYHEHTAAMETELLQLLNLVCGTLYRSNCAIQTSPTDCFNDSWRDTLLGTMDTALCDFWYLAPEKKHYLLTYLLTYLRTYLNTHLLTYLLTYLLIYLLIYLFTYLLTYILTYLLILQVAVSRGNVEWRHILRRAARLIFSARHERARVCDVIVPRDWWRHGRWSRRFVWSEWCTSL